MIDKQYIQKEIELEHRFKSNLEVLQKQIALQQAENLEQEKTIQEINHIQMEFEKVIRLWIQHASSMNKPVKPPLLQSLGKTEEVQFLLA